MQVFLLPLYFIITRVKGEKATSGKTNGLLLLQYWHAEADLVQITHEKIPEMKTAKRAQNVGLYGVYKGISRECSALDGHF